MKDHIIDSYNGSVERSLIILTFNSPLLTLHGSWTQVGGGVMDNSHTHAQNATIISPQNRWEEWVKTYPWRTQAPSDHLLISNRNTETFNLLICCNSIWYGSYLYLDICSSHNPTVDPCHQRQTCTDCLGADIDDGCMWCESHSQCVSKTTFDVTFPYLQCVQLLERGTGTCSGQWSSFRVIKYMYLASISTYNDMYMSSKGAATNKFKGVGIFSRSLTNFNLY